MADPWDLFALTHGGGGETVGELASTQPSTVAPSTIDLGTLPVPAPVTSAGQESQPIVSGTTFTNPNGTPFPERIQAVDNTNPAAFITHHTSGRGTVDGVVSTLKQRGLGVEYVMDREGNIVATGGPGAQNILAGWGPKGTGLNNSNVVGMEIIAKDNNDVTPAQTQSFARFMQARYPTTQIFGHGEVNPGHKEVDEGLAAKTAALALRTGGSQLATTTSEATSTVSPAAGQATADNFNQRLGGAFTGKGQAFIDAATRNGIDPHLLAAISMAETGNGTSHMVLTKNNPAGIYDSKAGTYRTFDSIESGLDYTARNLKNNYVDQGLDTIEKIGAKYAPVGASNDPNQTNREWSSLVKSQLAKFGVTGDATSMMARAATTPPTSTTPAAPLQADLASLPEEKLPKFEPAKYVPPPPAAIAPPPAMALASLTPPGQQQQPAGQRELTEQEKILAARARLRLPKLV